MTPFRVRRELRLDSSPAELWPFLSDTDRTNRLVGGVPVVYRPIEPGAATAARLVGHTTTAGFTLEYEELPFEWACARYFRVKRVMRSGVLDSYVYSVELEPGESGGSVVRINLEIAPRNALLRPVAWIAGRKMIGDLASLARDIDAHLAHARPSPFLGPVAAVNVVRFRDAVALLGRAGVPAGLADRLSRLVSEAPDSDVLRMRPYALADAWGEERGATLAVFLRGVEAGLLELRWGLVCPSCLTSSDEVPSLGAIGEHARCNLCDISFEVDLDRAVEATFFPAPGVRSVPTQFFCMGGPARTPHVLVQATAEPGMSARLLAPEEPGKYRVFLRGGARAQVTVEPGAPEEASLRASRDRVEPGEIRVAPGTSIEVINTSAEARHVKLERLVYEDQAATAFALSLRSDFRRLFSGDLLRPGTPLKVARVALLFSDLTGSTALYSTVGDAAAFRLVMDHFDVIQKNVVEHEGVVVKTMGDAVMAAFLGTRECLLASLAVLRAFEDFQRSHAHGAHTSIKLGFYAGPCYVVTANGTLDYFGQTVNVASRLQHLAEPGQIVLEAHVASELSGHQGLVVSEPFEARVKGFEPTLSLVRLSNAPENSAP